MKPGKKTARFAVASLLAGLALCVGLGAQAAQPPESDAAQVDFTWGVAIPMRDGVTLNATVYRPKGQKKPAPCVFTLTPYIGQNYHDRGLYFAARGYPFLTVDERGRGNSGGEFRAQTTRADGYDVVEWLARQPYCNGKVAMWGGSYAGNNQWVTASALPPHLAAIVPAASDQPGVDWPMGNNIPSTYLMQWLTMTSGRTSQQTGIFGDGAFWASRSRELFQSGRPFREFDSIVGNPSAIFQEWVNHPTQGPHWDAMNPTPEEYAKMSLPILTITGSYDGDQPGALAFYKQHMQYGNRAAKAKHYLIIGPWDHAGTRTPRAEIGGLKFGPASLVDLPELHAEWYAWAMQGGKLSKFLKKRVAYYVIGADKWRYADSLDDVTHKTRALYLDSLDEVAADDVFNAGSLLDKPPAKRNPDQYVYDPRDLSPAEPGAAQSFGGYVDQRGVLERRGKHLVYHSAPFEEDTEVSGFFRFEAWIAIDQPDTDFAVSVYEILADGSSVLLSNDQMRARYRESLREEKLVEKGEILRYDFDDFTFMSRQIAKGSRLRLVLGPINSPSVQKNYNSGGVVADETLEDARPVTVKLYHDADHPSALYAPIGAP